MKIHIVQKGDTLWEIAKSYGVDFEALKAANAHLSSPDMIMPGMKIRIPTTAKAVKKESVKKEAVKEAPTQQIQKEAKVPYKDISPKPMPVIKEDDQKPIMEIKPEMPMPQMPQIPQMTMPLIMPTLDQDFTTNLTFNLPDKDSVEAPEVKEETMEMPAQEEMQQPMYQPIQQPMYQPVHFVPCPCYPIHPCCAGHPMPMHPMHMMPPMGYPQVMPATDFGEDCGCGGGTNYGDIEMGAMPPFAAQPNIGFQGQPFLGEQTEANVTYPTMTGFNANNFPTPPGFGELRMNHEEESSD
ncbi:SafA/ExsA family spore coat assembly protein [Ornithinibacillus halotolerans]|uniref:LysM domain-containing protein n=1 Tax=Ornithinibacillus halotolerans TaxID=1274357 RepID=A0A916W678_9BACI|nr:SafA/ExsA family spore coat assembly protein [Ornithinibacillus halotolerans]GGA69309.1 hypothetical protein GCM10008025_11620 [Ornithinibacillus halotolerans]